MLRFGVNTSQRVVLNNVLLRRAVIVRALSGSPIPRGSNKKKKEVTTWTEQEVTARLSSVGRLNDADKKAWNALNATGRSLRAFTMEVLQKNGMSAGPAFEVASEIQALIGPVPSGVLDAKGLADFILKHNKLQGYLKEKFAEPVKLSTNTAKFARVARNKSLQTAYNAMATRLQNRLANPATASDRRHNPLPATVATTGGGKSFFLDELAALREEDLAMCEDEAMRKVLQDSVAVTITYNSACSFVWELDDIKPDRGLGLRVVFSYFVQPASMPFQHFEKLMRDVPLLSLSDAIECVREHSGKNVLLLVDEIMKAQGGKTAVSKVVSLIGACLNGWSYFNTVITALNGIVLKKETELSGRHTPLIELPPASLSEAKSLFKDADSSPTLALCIADCNGHFRSLETLQNVWSQHGYKDIPYPLLLRFLAAQMDTKYSFLTIPLIKAALRGQPVYSHDSVDGGPETYGDYLSHGYFLNTPGDRNSARDSTRDMTTKEKFKDSPFWFIPRVSPLQLLLFAQRILTAEATSQQNTTEYKCATAIMRLLDTEINFTWQQYEQFHAHWECLYRILFHGQKFTVSGFYKVLGKSTERTFSLSEKSTVADWPGDFPQTIKSGQLQPTPVIRDKDLTQCVIKPVSTKNPGFDLVYFEGADESAEPEIVCIQCKFSDTPHGDTLKQGDVQNALDGTLKQFAPYFQPGTQLGNLTMAKENLHLVVCAFRHVSVDEDNLPSNTIVLDREKLKELYSPSLTCRPQFILPDPNEQAQFKGGEVTKTI